MQQRWYHPDHVHILYTIQHFLHVMYLGVIIIIRLKKMTILKLCFIFSHLIFLLLFVFKIASWNVFFFIEFCVVHLVIKWRHKTYIYFILKWLTINFFLANKGNLQFKLKHVRNVVWSCFKKLSFHNFSSSMHILLNKYFCCNVPDFYVDGLPWRREYLYICVYMIWGYFYSSETVKGSWSDSQSSSAVLGFVCLCPHWDVTRASVCVC